MARVRVVVGSRELATFLETWAAADFVVVRVLEPRVAYLPRTIRRLRPRLAVLDAEKEDWPSLASRLKKALPRLRVVAIGPDDPWVVGAAYRAGVHSFFSSGLPFHLIAKGLKMICEIDLCFWPRSIGESLLARVPPRRQGNT
ncbi:MAG: hypothetical protein AB1330_02525 [Bacillota bacterium]